MQLNSKDRIVAARATTVQLHLDGEYIGDFPIAPGVTHARDILDLMPQGAEVELPEGVWLADRPTGMGRVDHDRRYSGAANPDYVPLRPDANALQMRRMTQALKVQGQRLQRLIENAENLVIEEIPVKPQAAPSEEPQEANADASKAV